MKMELLKMFFKPEEVEMKQIFFPPNPPPPPPKESS